MLSPELLQKIAKSDSDDNGRHCHYYKLNEDTGLKVYNDKYLCDRSYKAQLRCEALGLAPKTGEQFTLSLSNENDGEFEAYCYTTQHILPLTDEFAGEYVELIDGVTNSLFGCTEYVRKVYGNHNIKTCDACDFNCGLMPSGEIVMLDFGDVFFDGETDPDDENSDSCS